MSAMDVDTAPAADADPSSAGSGSGGGGGGGQEKTLKVHPLAIINITDHHTRVSLGGSASPPDSTCVGLLFGYQDGLVSTIVDAEEIEFSSLATTSSSSPSSAADAGEVGKEQRRQSIRTKIELHQKVFPTHEVMGWYRVSTAAASAATATGDGSGHDDDDGGEGAVPTEGDLRIHHAEMREYNESPLFVLFDAHPSGGRRAPRRRTRDDGGGGGNEGEESQQAADASDEMDDHLPLSVYEAMVTTGKGGGGGGEMDDVDGGGGGTPRAVFVNLDFELETFEPERIAVERVFETRPRPTVAATAVVTTAPSASAVSDAKKPSAAAAAAAAAVARKKKGASSKADGSTDAVASTAAATAAVASEQSELDHQLEGVQSSLRSMNARVAVLLEYLRKVERGDLPPDHALLRQVDGLIRQLPFAAGGAADFSTTPSKKKGFAREFEDEYDDMLLLSHLASVARTAKAVQGYAEKFRAVHEASGREMRRTGLGPGGGLQY